MRMRARVRKQAHAIQKRKCNAHAPVADASATLPPRLDRSYLPEGAHEPPAPRPFGGCFGETVITGHRRQRTHIARTYCEMLILTRKDMVRVFAANPRPAKRIIQVVLESFRRKQRLRLLALKIALFMAPRGSEVRHRARSVPCHIAYASPASPALIKYATLAHGTIAFFGFVFAALGGSHNAACLGTLLKRAACEATGRIRRAHR